MESKEVKTIVFGGLKYETTDTSKIKEKCSLIVKLIEENKPLDLSQAIFDLQHELDLFRLSSHQLTDEELKEHQPKVDQGLNRCKIFYRYLIEN